MARDDTTLWSAARHVAAADDPAAELRKIAQLQTSADRQRHRRTLAGAILGCLVIGLATLLLLDRPGQAGWVAAGDPVARADWIRTVVEDARSDGLSTQHEAQLQRLLQDPSSLVRRWAVLGLAQFGRPIPPDVLRRMAEELTETIDRPEEVASTGSHDVQTALRSNHKRTLRAVALAVWMHCAREHAFPYVGTIEALAACSDEEVRKSAYEALAALPGYRPPQELRARIEQDTRAAGVAARDLLSR